MKYKTDKICCICTSLYIYIYIYIYIYMFIAYTYIQTWKSGEVLRSGVRPSPVAKLNKNNWINNQLTQTFKRKKK